MIERLCFLVTYNPYGAARQFTLELAAAWRRYGVEVEVFDLAAGVLDEAGVRQILAWRPTLTCSFSTIEPVQGRLFLWDLLKIPHWAITVDPAPYYASLLQSPYAIVSCVDREDCAALVSSGFKRTFFFPHAVAAELGADTVEYERIYDVVMLGSCYDYEGLRAYWQDKLTPAEQQVLEDAIARTARPRANALLEALRGAWQEAKLGSDTTHFGEMFYYLDRYVRGRARVELVRSLRTVPVHIFGDLFREHPSSQRGWQEYLQGQSNIVFHPSLPFAAIPAVLRRSKICLNSMPFFKQGSHERLLTALACGALPISSDSQWLRENFNVGKELLIYGDTELPLSQVEEAIIQLIHDEERRHQMVARGGANVLASHTWDQRVQAAAEQLPPLLEMLYYPGA